MASKTIEISKKNVRRLRKGRTQTIAVPATTRANHKPILSYTSPRGRTRTIPVRVVSTSKGPNGRLAVVAAL